MQGSAEHGDLPAQTFLSGVTLVGDINIDTSTLVANVRSAIRRGLPQVWRVAGLRPDRIVIVGGGPSLHETFHELRALYFEGAKVVALNGSLQWLLERNIRPSAHIILDGREANVSFLTEAVPGCKTYLASQVHPAVFDQAERLGLDVAVFHDGSEPAVNEILDAYYLGHWQSVPGGTTVATRAIGLLRMLGYVRFELFGIDSCWSAGPEGPLHHAFPQAQNDADSRLTLTIDAGDDCPPRQFLVAPWHLKQLDDFLLFIAKAGGQFVLNVHGEGLLAYALRARAGLTMSVTQE